MKPHNERWWAQLTMSSRAQKAMRAVDRVDTVEFKNDTLEDFKVILKERRLFLLRGVGENTHNELCQLVGMDPHASK